MFFGVSALQLRSKIDKKTSPDRSKMKQKFGQHLDPFFDWFWDQLGSNLGGFWRPSWSHVGTKWHQNVIPKSIKKTTVFWKASGTNFNEFFIDFGSILGGPGGSNEPVFWWLDGSWSQDAPKTPPRASPTRRLKSVQKPNFGWFLVDFGSI